jgi:hypothetical protein
MRQISWKYPPAWQQWSYRMARAIFRMYSGKTDIDPRHEHEAVKCTCGEAELCTDHIIGYCRLFDKARDEASIVDVLSGRQQWQGGG